MKRTSKALICGTGTGLLIAGMATNAFADFDTGVLDWAIGELCGHITGHLGGLLVTVAGFGAIVAAAMGSYRVFYGAIITAVGAFAVSAIMSLYFQEAASVCDNGAGAGGGGAAQGGGGVGPGGAPIDGADPFGEND